MKRQFLVPRVALRERGDDDVVVSRSSFPLVFFVFFFRTTVVSVSFCSSLCFFFFSSSSSLERAAREREKRARAKKSMHVNLEQKRRDVSACFRSSVDDFFLLLSLLRRVSFKRTKDQPTNTKEEALKVFLCVYIYI